MTHEITEDAPQPFPFFYLIKGLCAGSGTTTVQL